MPEGDLHERAEAVRRFNRFYTQKIGVLRGRRFWGSFSLTDVRVLYEVAHRDAPTAAALAKDLGLDQGYLSRILANFSRLGLLDRSRSKADGRAHHLSLTKKGLALLAPIDARAHAEIEELLAPRPDADQVRILEAMRTIEELLGNRRKGGGHVVIRASRLGDLGWVVHRHGVLYGAEQGWDERFEALVARVVADYVAKGDARRKRCFIAERDGAIVGYVFVVEKSRTTAQLRLLLVEPNARGSGLGARLVDECTRFARQAGYRRMVLWTEAGLLAARRIYERAGFRMVAEERHRDFGRDCIGQTWELKL